ncbi:hypothetical protein M408DRAFT_331623 [Serendipita vermifera MAFF 305830]|uniref:Uncharacterized protein n=1 Tax=Serendipita vermifera MAFF 305830 TaxID=933852 RepID=A0A0C3AXV6_SERVB|nr:hypothetical protein M408DRAFT_331623 [Serendipita vermifera MAFF 305830]
MGRKDEIRKLGWATFTQYVKAACERNLLELIKTGPKTKFLSLLGGETPAPVPLKWNTNDGLPDIVTDLDNVGQDDTKHQYLHLLKEILFLSENRTNYKLPLNQILRHMKEKAKSSVMEQLGWNSIESLILGAVLEGYVVQGNQKKIRWVMATEKGHKAVQNKDKERRSIHDAENPPSSSTKVISRINPYPPNVLSNDAHPPIRPKSATPEVSNRPRTETHDLRYFIRQRPVISTIRRLTGDIRGKKVLLQDILSTLQLHYPLATKGFLTGMVNDTEKDGTVIRERDISGTTWMYLPSPPEDPGVPPTAAANPCPPQGPAPATGYNQSFHHPKL